jgi:hypothetical protein
MSVIESVRLFGWPFPLMYHFTGSCRSYVAGTKQAASPGDLVGSS